MFSNKKNINILPNHASQRLQQVEKLSKFWKNSTQKDRHVHFQAAYKNTNDFFSEHSKEMKKNKTTDTRKEEKSRCHSYFTLMKKNLNKSSEWDILKYIEFFMDLICTQLSDCPRDGCMIECRNSILHEIEQSRSLFIASQLFEEEDNVNNNNNNKSTKGKNKKRKSKKNSNGGNNNGKNGTNGEDGNGNGESGVVGERKEDSQDKGDSKGDTTNNNSNNNGNIVKLSKKEREKKKQKKKKMRQKLKKEEAKRMEEEKVRQEQKEYQIEEDNREIKSRLNYIIRCLEDSEKQEWLKRDTEIKKKEKKEKKEMLELKEQQDYKAQQYKNIQLVKRQQETERQLRIQEEQQQQALNLQERKRNQTKASIMVEKERERQTQNLLQDNHLLQKERLKNQSIAKNMMKIEQNRRINDDKISKVLENDLRKKNAQYADTESEKERDRQMRFLRRDGIDLINNPNQYVKEMKKRRESLLNDSVIAKGTQPGSRPGSQPGSRPGVQPGVQPGARQRSRQGERQFLKSSKEENTSKMVPKVFAAGGWNLKKKEKERVLDLQRYQINQEQQRQQQQRQQQQQQLLDQQKQQQRAGQHNHRVPRTTTTNNNSPPNRRTSSSATATSPSSSSSTTSSSILSMDNREGMYRRGVVRNLAVLSAIEILSERYQKKQHRNATNNKNTVPNEKTPQTSNTSQNNKSTKTTNTTNTIKTPPTTKDPQTTKTIKTSSNVSNSTSGPFSNNASIDNEIFCIYGARALNTYINPKEQLFTEDLDIQVYLGPTATAEDFYTWCRTLCTEMTTRWELHTINTQNQFKKYGEILAKKLILKSKNPKKEKKQNLKKVKTKTIDPAMDMFAKRELEMTCNIAIDRGSTFSLFPWWRGSKTSCSIHPPGGIKYPGDDLSSTLVLNALSAVGESPQDIRQYRSLLQPHDVTHCKFHALGPVVDFTWLKIKPDSKYVKARNISIALPKIERGNTHNTHNTHSNEKKNATNGTTQTYMLPMRSLRWLDRANLLTLLGGSLENEWRRQKDYHRRQYLSWLQTLNLLLPDENMNKREKKKMEEEKEEVIQKEMSKEKQQLKKSWASDADTSDDDEDVNNETEQTVQTSTKIKETKETKEGEEREEKKEKEEKLEVQPKAMFSEFPFNAPNGSVVLKEMSNEMYDHLNLQIRPSTNVGRLEIEVAMLKKQLKEERERR